MGLPLILGAVSAAGGIAKGVGGYSMMSKAKNEIDNYDEQVLTNAHENLRLRTEGIDAAKEENARLSSSALDVVRAGGYRSILGLYPGLYSKIAL